MYKGIDVITEAPTRSGGHFLPPIDNTYDLGSAAFSWRNAHIETAIYATSVVGNWSPSATGTYTLGTASLGWLGLFIDATGGTDADIDIIKLLVTGTPKFWWDESEDAFALSHGLILADAKDIEIGAAGAIKSGATNTDTMLLKANDTTFITFTTAATDVCTLNAVTMKGTWLADGIVFMPAITLSGDISGNTKNITNANITVGADRTLDVSAGTLTLSADQISGDKIEGGTIGSITITALVTSGITMGDAGAINTGVANDDYFTIGAVDNDTNTITEMMRFVGAAAPQITFGGPSDYRIKFDPAITGLYFGVSGDTWRSLLKYDHPSFCFQFRSQTDAAWRNLEVGIAYISTSVTIRDTMCITTGDADNDYFTIKADDTGVGVVEIARAQGAADPYFSMGGSQEFKFYNSGVATFGGAITMGEVGIKLDTSIGTDQNYSGIVVAGTLGMTVVKGEICMLQSDEKWDKAQANSEAAGYGMLGICLVGGDDAGATTMLLYGTYRDDTAHEYTSGGQPLYLSDTSAGDFITTKPDTTNDIVRICAYVLYDKETVFFNPDGAYVTIA